jgi:hypothetical protein
MKDLIRNILKEEHTNKMVKLIGQYMNAFYPNFKEDEVDVEYYDYGNYTMEVFRDKETKKLYARYIDHKKELELNDEMAESLTGIFNEDDMIYIIDWFNNEFGANAEYVSYIGK